MQALLNQNMEVDSVSDGNFSNMAGLAAHDCLKAENVLYQKPANVNEYAGAA